MSEINIKKENKVTSTELAIKRTKMANERTYLAYMRTGFGIASIAGAFKKWWVFIYGILMITLSSIQYYIINLRLQNKKDPSVPVLELFPLIYVILGMGVLYLQWTKKNK